ncbi:MAG: hypothetical protein ACLP8S_12915 [Solirubrobacteraceae bacterium]
MTLTLNHRNRLRHLRALPDATPQPLAHAADDSDSGEFVEGAATDRRADSVGIYRTDPHAPERATHELQPVLRLDRVRGW